MESRYTVRQLEDSATVNDIASVVAPTSAASALRVIAVMNQKGGVGKTTTAVNLGAAMARLGRRVLMIDLDPQAHMTLHMGIDPTQLETSVYHVLTDDDVPVSDAVRIIHDGLAVLPSEVNLAGVETELAPKMVTGLAQRVLRAKLAPYLRGPQAPEVIVIDCPPSLGLLTINALTLAREVIVPMQAHFLALQGLGKLLETVALVRQAFNPDLTVSGVVLCMHESQTLLAGEVVADLTQFLEQGRQQDVPWRRAQLLAPPIRRNIKLAECPSFGKTIFDYAPACAGAQDYQQLAQSVLAMPQDAAS
ncbi:MAG: ParA family protein [Phycisphaeraceae bacterium]|nr:ParA family protein [Phycisphaeraceae bacterium]